MKRLVLKRMLRSLLLFLFFLTPHSLLPTPIHADITNPAAPTFSTGDPGAVLAIMIASIWKAMVVLGGLSFVIYFLWGALRWMTAESDKAKFESGREKITTALTGLVLIAASVAIIELLGRLLNIPFLETLSFTIPNP